MSPEDSAHAETYDAPLASHGLASSLSPEHMSRWVSVRKFISFRNISAFYVLLALILLFSLWIPGLFLNATNLRTTLLDSTITTMLGVGLCAPLAAGVFDVSVGAMAGVASVIIGVLVVNFGLPWPLALVITVLCGVSVGILHALLVIKLKIDSFIATLATMSILVGVGTGIGGVNIIVGFPHTFDEFGGSSFLDIGYPVYLLILVGLAVWYVLERTVAGRWVYATGGNAEAARLAGVRTTRVITAAFLASGAIAAFAGVVASAELQVGEASIGPPYLLPAFASVFLGATQFKAGRINVWGTVLASYTLAVGVQGFLLAGAASWVANVFDGVALAVAVGLSARRANAARTSSSSTSRRAGGDGGPFRILASFLPRPVASSEPKYDVAEK